MNVFDYINKNDNDKISFFSSNDLIDLIGLIDNYDLVYGNKLCIDKDISFGIEIECENANRTCIFNDIKKTSFGINERSVFSEHDDEYFYWIIKGDASLNETNGCEVTSPIMHDKKKYWNQIKEVCSIMRKYSTILSKAGGHIHIGSQILKYDSKYLLNLFKLFSTYENIIYRFSYGEMLNGRNSIKEFSKPCAIELWKNCELFDDDSRFSSIIDNVCSYRDYGINFGNVLVGKNKNEINKNTIEIRCPNGTLNEIIWQNNINFFVKLLDYCNKDYFNNSLVSDRHLLNEDIYGKIEFYNEIFLDQALELTDLIFNNNEDKVYFLKQYLKGFYVEEKYGKSLSLTSKEH